MRARLLALLIPAALSGACSDSSQAPPVEAATGPAERSEIVFQAVDAGTGGALADTTMTVRHLVRFPITLDSAAIDRVPSAEPYHIAHLVAQDSMVVEVQVDAPSYHRLDTALVVARGGSAGPLTLRMARRLERTARRPVPGAPNATRQAPTSSAETPGAAAPPSTPPSPDAGVDRRALQAGDRAFEAKDWLAAADAYGRMPVPEDKTSAYGNAYGQALVRLGVAHLNRGEMASALDVFQSAVAYPSAGYVGRLRLGATQCAVGRLDDGRQTLRQVERASSARERPVAAALAQDQLAVCDYWAFKQAATAMDRLSTGARAVRALEAFIQVGDNMKGAPATVTEAVADARTKVAEIRDRMRRGGGE
jgi:hypothetical protein